MKIAVSKDIKIISLLVVAALVVGIVSWLLVKPERRTAGSELSDYSPQINQEVDTASNNDSAAPGVVELIQNSVDNTIKTDANNLIAAISDFVMNNRGAALQANNIDSILMNTELGQKDVKLTLLSQYNKGDIPASSNEFYYLPGYVCESYDGSAEPGSSRSFVIIARMTSGRSICLQS